MADTIATRHKILRPEDEEEIRYIVGRDPDAGELATFDSIDAISPAVEAMAVAIGKRGRILACKYLFERASNGPWGDMAPLLEQLTARHRDLEKIKTLVGRDLALDELARFGTLEALSPAVEAVAATIARSSDRLLAMRYVRERAPTAESDEALSKVDLIAKTPR